VVDPYEPDPVTERPSDQRVEPVTTRLKPRAGGMYDERNENAMTTDYVHDLRDLIGRDAVDPHADKIGTVSGVSP